MRILSPMIVGSCSSAFTARRRRWFYFALFAFVFATFISQGCEQRSHNAIIRSLDDLNSPKFVIGVEKETNAFLRAIETFPLAEKRQFDDPAKLAEALKNGEIDAVAHDRPYLEYFAAVDPCLVVLPESVGENRIAVVAPDGQQDFVRQVNEFIAIFRAEHVGEDLSEKWNGAFNPVNSSTTNLAQEMRERWFESKDGRLPDIPAPTNPINAGRPYVVGVALDNIPVGFYDESGEPTGFEVEFLKRLALFMNAEIVLQPHEFEQLYPALYSETVDLACGFLDLEANANSSLIFSEPYLDAPTAVMVRQDRYASDERPIVYCAGFAPVAQITVDQLTFTQRIKRSFEKTFLVENRWKLFWGGLLNTIYITVVATIMGTLLAVLQCCMRRSHRAWLRYPAKVYIAFMQGTPILVILLVLYYVVFTKFSISGELVAAIALALNFAAYAGEQMRTGVDGIDKGLLEAAVALGFGRFDVFRKIIFPIACRRIMPVYKGEFISLLKTTSIVGYVAIQDLTKASDIVRGRTYEAFFPLIATALIYLITAHLLASGFAYLEYRLDPITRRKRAKGEVNV